MAGVWTCIILMLKFLSLKSLRHQSPCSEEQRLASANLGVSREIGLCKLFCQKVKRTGFYTSDLDTQHFARGHFSGQVLCVLRESCISSFARILSPHVRKVPGGT